FLGSAQALTSKFNQIDTQLQNLDSQIGQQAGDIGRQINTYAQQVGQLNDQISKALAINPNAPPNDLLDQRDLLINKISAQIDVKATADGQGNINLSLGSGQALVLNGTATPLTVGNPPSGLSMMLGNTDITTKVTGGTLGGMLQAQSQLITPLRNQLGQAGTGAVSGTFTDPSLLTGQTYTARYDGSNWQVRTQPDNGAAPVSVASGGALSLPGLNMNFSGTPQTGDVLNILPTVGAAGKINVVQQNASGIAAAAAGQPAYARDNTQINALFALSSTNFVGQSAVGANNGSSLSDTVGQAMSQAGAFAAGVQLSAAAASSTLANLTAQQQSVSGVNLDEEAANLMKYQQNYQALAQSISSANTVFQSLLSAFR
ncbi:MAG: hypothetical protein B7Y53_04885, partial [Halothiobacillus sp. 28-55-5]